MIYLFMTLDDETEIAHSEIIHGDYVNIIKKLREKNKFTIVFGKKHASKELIKSCNMFKPWDE